ncbi:MAG: PhnA domain-containing protein [Microthrixaceae bacterium]
MAPWRVRDANGTLLSAGDDVVTIKDLKLNGKSGGVKIGTKVKSISIKFLAITRSRATTDGAS